MSLTSFDSGATGDSDYFEPRLAKSTYVLQTGIQHLQQSSSWDCGLTCIFMLLEPSRRNRQMKNIDKICAQEGFHHLTYTIDLCYLLKRYGVRHVMYTDVLEDDNRPSRVKSRFKSARSSGVTVIERSVTTADFVTHLYMTGPIILLIDSWRLFCDWCKHNRLRVKFGRVFNSCHFGGHYILLVGYNWDQDKVLYHDPEVKAPLCTAPSRRVRRARKASGTNGDAIFVNKLYG